MGQRRPHPHIEWATDDVGLIVGVRCPHCDKQIFLQDLGRNSYEAYCYHRKKISMSKFEGTPGPWQEWQPDGAPHTTRIVAQDNTIVAELNEWRTPWVGQAAANAQLIASAPELLDALTRLAAWAVSTQTRAAIADTVDVMDYAEIITTAYAVINKATKGE